ncbi:MAG: flagellar basal body L-ring protein FlgH [Bryobacteraceae bacterium]|jgi:flagellar L-ring protein precursor FlgH
MKLLISILLLSSLVSGLLVAADGKGKKKAQPPTSALDKYIQEALHSTDSIKPESPGSLWIPSSTLGDLASDVRSRNVNDLVSIQVVESVSAVSGGQLTSNRSSSLSANVTQLAGIKSPTGALANLLGASSASTLAGTGSTTRTATITTTLAARVTHVLPNGYLVLEATKDIQVNSEKQVVTVRGVARPADLANNTVLSSNLAQLEVQVNGKGVVGDAIHRPFILYRLLMSILPI